MIAIKIENLSKRYQLGVISRKTLTHDVQSWWARKRGKEDPNAKLFRKNAAHADTAANDGFIWALNDVSIDIAEGDVLGIIGRNGAGKSTLLKILSRVTAPTSGAVRMKGKLASLLEVGTGFHPELTGRENVFLNGAILGMKKTEIAAKYEQISAFAEIEQYMDTPVKRYSSGMYVRLAFAVAAHLDPDILVIDEVLAVGDASFQSKCIGKIGDVSQSGRTVLFVSHNMAAVRQLCKTSVLIQNGRIAQSGATSSIIESYLSGQVPDAERHSVSFEEDGTKDFQLLEVRLRHNNSEPGSTFECDEMVHLGLTCVSRNPVPGLYGYMTISRADGTVVLESDSAERAPNAFDGLGTGTHVIDIVIPNRSLAPGKYFVYFNFSSTRAVQSFHVDSPGTVCSFTMVDSTSVRGNARNGFLSLLLQWTLAR